MEQTGLAYVAVIIGGLTLVSPDAIPQEKCEMLRQSNTSLIWMCIDKDADCGRLEGMPRCKDDHLLRRRYAR